MVDMRKKNTTLDAGRAMPEEAFKVVGLFLMNPSGYGVFGPPLEMLLDLAGRGWSLGAWAKLF